MVNCTDCGRIASLAGKIRASVNRTRAPGRGWRQVGITPHPDNGGMAQVARNVTDSH